MDAVRVKCSVTEKGGRSVVILFFRFGDGLLVTIPLFCGDCWCGMIECSMIILYFCRLNW